MHIPGNCCQDKNSWNQSRHRRESKFLHFVDNIMWLLSTAHITLKYFNLILGGKNCNCLHLFYVLFSLAALHFQGEIKPGTDIHSSYKEMCVNISADSFEKVDAAMSIIELLITSVTVSLVISNDTSLYNLWLCYKIHFITNSFIMMPFLM